MPLVIRFLGDSGLGSETQNLLQNVLTNDIYSSDSATTGDAVLTIITPRGEVSLGLESTSLYSSLSSADQSIPSESPLIIFLPLDLSSSDEAFLWGSAVFSTDYSPVPDPEIKIILLGEYIKEFENQFHLSLVLSTGFGSTESLSAIDSELIERLNFESPQAPEILIKTIMDINITQYLELQYPMHTIPLSAWVTESVAATDTALRILSLGDLSSSFDTQIFNFVPPPSTNTITDLFQSILQVIQNSGLVGPIAANFVIDPDSIILWPADPTPLALLEPGEFTDTGNAVGAGRHAKIWSVEIIVHVIVNNYFDEAYKDTIITTSEDLNTGPYALAHQIINNMEQSYPLNTFGQPTTVELPFFVETLPLRRYKGTNEYAGIPLRFTVTFRENLPLQLP
jgi:hypothetical protein